MKQRILTAALLIPPVLLAVFLSSFYFLYVAAIGVFLVGYVELRALSGAPWRGLPLIGIVLFASTFPVWAQMHSAEAWPFLYQNSPLVGHTICVVASIVGSLGALYVARGGRGAALAELVSLWVAAPLVSLVLLKFPYVRSGPLFDWDTPILLALIPIWIGDTLAIFAGKAFGKHLMAPKISPKKTWEGGLANLLGCLGGAIGVALLIGQPMIVGVLVGLATGILGQLGDLLESAMKRSARVKDSGTLLPGHGGLLDRIDSILLSAPAVALIVVMLGKI